MGADKIIAGILALLCVAGLIYLNWLSLTPGGKVEEGAALNPEYVKCRTQRLADVTRMKNEGLIDEAKFEQFSKRAVDLCAAQYPPEKK
ncbi:MAG: hypothetical protein ACR2OR_09640 [Hyphomicrobiales bacterium]